MQNNQEEDQKVVINGIEYDPDEALNLIETGKATREAEERYNTKFDKVWPEYGRSQTELQESQKRLKDLETELEELKSKSQVVPSGNSDGNPSNPSYEGLTNEQKKAARSLGVVFQEDLEKNGYLTQDKFQELFQKAQSEYSQQQEEIRRVLDEADNLEKEINGSDGRPKFRKDLVMPYAAAYNLGDLKEAYQRMYKDDLDTWKSQQVASQKKPSLKTLGSSGAKAPSEPRVTRDNLNDFIKEALRTPEE